MDHRRVEKVLEEWRRQARRRRRGSDMVAIVFAIIVWTVSGLLVSIGIFCR